MYRDLAGLLVSARTLDRRFLCGLSASAWDSVADRITRALDDRAIAGAVRRMPEAYVRASGARVAGTLRARRDGLPGAARRYRALLHAGTCPAEGAAAR